MAVTGWSEAAVNRRGGLLSCTTPPCGCSSVLFIGFHYTSFLLNPLLRMSLLYRRRRVNPTDAPGSQMVQAGLRPGVRALARDYLALLPRRGAYFCALV